MPRAVFSLLWERIQHGEEVFAYVNNMARNGDHYWVLAHVTPTFDDGGRIIGHHSNRRLPGQQALETIKPIYARMLNVERQHSHPGRALAASTGVLQEILAANNADYDQLIFSLQG